MKTGGWGGGGHPAHTWRIPGHPAHTQRIPGHPAHARAPGAYPAHTRAPGAYPAHTRAYPAHTRAPGAYPAHTRAPGAYPAHTRRIPGAYPGTRRIPGRAPPTIFGVAVSVHSDFSYMGSRRDNTPEPESQLQEYGHGTPRTSTPWLAHCLLKLVVYLTSHQLNSLQSRMGLYRLSQITGFRLVNMGSGFRVWGVGQLQGLPFCCKGHRAKHFCERCCLFRIQAFEFNFSCMLFSRLPPLRRT